MRCKEETVASLPLDDLGNEHDLLKAVLSSRPPRLAPIASLVHERHLKVVVRVYRGGRGAARCVPYFRPKHGATDAFSKLRHPQKQVLALVFTSFHVWRCDECGITGERENSSLCKKSVGRIRRYHLSCRKNGPCVIIGMRRFQR